ncbi:MAG: hypothetical protein GX254_10170 [Clostridiales bacterium]|jgi:hypothetical protein|nr:hypothetical protein [Clostridiales bacterium]
MKIQCYDDFVHELKRAGFSIAGENPEGIFSLSMLFGDKIQWHTENPETDPWEWRMRVLEERDDIAYGKLFFKKSGFITKEWYPYFLCMRRKGRSFTDEYNDGNISYEAKKIYETVSGQGPIAMHVLKRAAGFSGSGNSRFDSAIIELQMKMFVTICGRSYRSALNKGWSSTVFCTCERFFGEEVFRTAAKIDRDEAFERISSRIMELNPNAERKRLERFICG